MQVNRQRPTAAILAALVGLLVYLAGSSSARAYPQFQFSTDNSRCDLCHFAPVGGGLINGFGRDEASDTISSQSGQGGLLHGLWAPPRWFQLGGDFRGAGIIKKGSDGAELLGFPMQADLYARLAAGNFSFNTVVGLRGAAREPRRGPLGRLISREHFFMWQQSSSGTYARAGRFFPTYGLRLVDHTAYVRRYLGLHTLEETYNLGAGQVKDKWELHGTLFVPPPIFGVGAKASGGTLYYERRIREDTGAFGVQSRVAVAPDESRYWLGGVGKLWFSEQKLLFLSELNLGLQTFAGDAGPRMQMAGYLGATYFWRQGWMLGAALEHYDADLTLTGTARDALGLSVQYFPLAHVEVMLHGKYELVGGFGESNPMAMLMLHYYL